MLDPHQGAYCCDKSTSEILLLAVDHIVQSVDAGWAVCVSLLDLQKAFDSLDHCILLQRICDLGVAADKVYCGLRIICLVVYIELRLVIGILIE